MKYKSGLLNLTNSNDVDAFTECILRIFFRHGPVDLAIKADFLKKQLVMLPKFERGILLHELEEVKDIQHRVAEIGDELLKRNLIH